MALEKRDKHSYQDRVSTAHAALNMIINNKLIEFSVDELHFWTLVILCSQMAELDIITHNITYREQVQKILDYPVNPTSAIKDALLYGYAASKAYTAYQNESHLKLAQEMWDLAWKYFISDEVYQSKRIATKSLPLQTDCNGWPLLGGVFKTPDSRDGGLDATTDGSFLTLSALLAESTSNATYTKVATQVVQFLQVFNILQDDYGANSAQFESPLYGLEDNTTDTCYNSTHKPQFIWYPTTGDMIEGLSILASINNNASVKELTSNENVPIHDLLQTTIQSATLLRKYQRPDGILDLGAGYVVGYPTGDPLLVRGLATAYRRNHSSEIADSIKKFTDIQYNALLNNSAFPETNIYGGSWIGPPQRTLSFENQSLAAMVLVQAINLIPSPTTTNVSTSGIVPSTGLPSSTGSIQSKKTGIIAGSVAGGVAFIVILAGLIFVFIYKRKQSHQAPSTPHPPTTHAISPFILPKPEMDIAPQPTKVITSHPNIQPVEDLGENQSMDQPGLVASGEADGNEVDLHIRFQGMSTAQMVRILNTHFESESLPPAYPQSQLGGGSQVFNARHGSI